MGGLSHLLYFNQDSMARKVLTRKKHSGGLDAPRNSLDLVIETSQSYPAVGENIPDSYEIRHDWSEKYYPNESSMKKLINEEISTVPNTRRNAPSVVARLMGMDMLPADATCLSQPSEKQVIKPGANLSKEQKQKDLVSHARGFSSSSSQITFDSYQHPKDRDTSLRHVSGKSRKFKHREHPQEEELQKFKKEFEAWQTARFLECSKVVEHDRNSTQWLAQETLNKEKIALYSNSRRLAAAKKPIERKGQAATERSCEGSEVRHHEYYKDTTSSEHSESHSSRTSYQSKDLNGVAQIKSGPKLDTSSAPTRIVILRPGPERISDSEESWVNSSSTSEERGSMEDFLEEVKERLRRELQGKGKGGTMVRGCGIETPYSEKPSDPKQIAQQIAKQVRESVTRGLGMNLLRSESTRSYRSEMYNGPTSPEYINRGTRRLLTERLTNVLKGEPDLPKAASGISNSSMLDNGRCRQSFGNMKNGGNLSSWDLVDDESVQSGSFRHGPDDDIMNHRDLSPRNLIRSLSAPVSGTSFGKLLLEDRHVLTGAHIRRKHEVVGSVALDVTKRKKDRFNFREKVSSIRYSFILKGRLFGRKLQSSEQPRNYEHYSRKDITSGPTVMMNSGETNENSTEVPPSPASVCSSVYDDSWRVAGPTGYLSPTSTSDLSQLEETTMPRVFREISSNLNELRRQLNALDAGGSEEAIIKEQYSEAEMDSDDEAEAYIRELLVASGLYEGSSDNVLSRWDPLARPISNTVFEKAEEARRSVAKDDDESKRDQIREMLDRKLLLDLCNKALSVILGPPVSMSSFMKKAVGPTLRPPQGKKLLKCVWDMVRGQLYPPTDETYHSLDGMMARDLGSTPWFGLVSDEIDALGKEIEYRIIDDLVDEVVKDMRL